MDPDLDPDPAIFVIDLQNANKKLGIYLKFFLGFLLFEGTFTTFSKDKKKSQTSRNRRFFLLFLLDDRRIRIHTCD
jgi:hypothetical protein